MVKNIIKRDGSVQKFEAKKIDNAISKAFIATGEIDSQDIPVQARATEMLVVESLPEEPTVEQVQDAVERVLMTHGFPQTAKAYILYRKQHEKVRETKDTLLDVKKQVDSYIGPQKDWRVKENSTVSLSLGGLILSNSGAIIANYWLDNVYDDEISDAHRNADIHIHDLSMLAPYCAGWSLKQLIQEGLGGVPGRITSAPARHLSTLSNQMVNFLGILQNEWAGAQAFSSFDTYLAPFVKKDNLSYKQVKQCIQSFVYGVNTPSRWGCVDENTELLTVDGFKRLSELKKGELIYTWKDGALNTCPINEIVVKQHDGKMHLYEARGYRQFVTPYHRVLYKAHNEDIYKISQSEDIFSAQTPYALPTAFKDSLVPDASALSDDEVRLAAIVYCDGSVDSEQKTVEIRNCCNKGAVIDILHRLSLAYSENGNSLTLCDAAAARVMKTVGDLDTIDKKFLAMGKEKSAEFLRTWSSLDADAEKYSIQYTDEITADAIQHIALRAGHCSYRYTNCGKTYVKIRQTENVIPTSRTEEDYKGVVWCPNVADGTAVFRSNGCVFISGQCQAPFSNVTLDWVVPEDMKNMPAIVGGENMDFTYGDCQKEMDMVNKAFIEIMIEGDDQGRGFQYPIPTYSITKNFDWSDTENNRLLFEMAAKYGTPYFSNYVNSDMNPSDVRSMCCRLRLDLRELRKKSGGFFGSGESTGSIGVVTLNMPRIGYLSKSKEDFYARLDHMMDISARSLDAKRAVVTRLMDEGLYPYTKRYLGTFNNHFSTIGLVGMNEAARNAKWLQTDLTTEKGQQFAKEVLDHMRNRLSDYQEKYSGTLFNLEATPAESTTYRLAKHDVARYPDIITAAKPGATPFYTNSSHVPVGTTTDIFEALDLQDDLQTRYTSGTVFHAFLGEKLPDWQSAATIVKKISDNYHLPYFTLSPTYSVCPDCGYIAGEHYTCPKCGKETEVYSRITGYYRPLKNWNDGKAEEFKERKTYDVIGKLREKAQTPAPATKASEATEKASAAPVVSKPTLIATTTCPNCRIVKAMMAQIGYEYDLVYADKEPELARKLNIMSAPTLVLPLNDGTYRLIENASNIKGYLDTIRK
jgi:anaerobic ribonucleoside-triphosphate reductase